MRRAAPFRVAVMGALIGDSTTSGQPAITQAVKTMFPGGRIRVRRPN